MIDIEEELQNRPGFLIRRAHQVSSALLMQEFEPLGITPSGFIVLSIIAAAPDSDQARVAKLAYLDVSTMALVMKKVVRDGLVLRKRDPADRRRNTLTITAKGIDVLRHARMASKRAVRRQLAVFGPGDAKTFLDLLRVYIKEFGGR